MQHAPPLLLFKNAGGELLADPAGYLRANWSAGPRTAADTRALFEQMLQQLRQRRWDRILVNQVGMQPFTSAEQQWIAINWLPRAVQEGGYRFGAVVVSNDVLVRLATAFVTTHVQGLPLVYRSFENEVEAVQWLVKQSV
ncbi:hypothetical protein [Hymenobacter rubidus]|uniref:hypothetical protein n=1 Tax=Hymenobacter rubidus TaxID=1441626 RepID=UPI00191D6886|nr:hypothetical protein [Hymenobacter rubidus]